MPYTHVPPPFADELTPGWARFVNTIPGVTNDSEKELINFNLPQGETLITIPFAATKASSNLVLVGPVFVNVVDDAVISDITFSVVNFSTSAMTIVLSSAVDTDNYYLKTIVFVVGAFPATNVSQSGLSGSGGGIATSINFGSILNLPTTLGGYGITDGELSLGDPSVDGYVLSSTTGGTRSWISPSSFSLPSQVNQSGKFLQSNGTDTAWVSALDLNSAQVMTNKVIDGSANTLQNIPRTALEGYATSTLSLTDPNADSVPYWNDTAGEFQWTPLTGIAAPASIAAFMGTSTVRGISKDVYIAVRTDGRTGTGTAEDPFNAGGSDDNAKATAFDGLMNNYQSTSNVIFHLSAGDYRTDIENRTWVPQPGWRMEGAGMYGTTIKGVTSASSLGAFDHEVIKATLSVATDSFVLRNLTLDANGSVISALAPLANSERNCSVYGLSIAGSNILIENVRVIHQYGSAANLQEAFGLSVRGPSTSNGKNNEIRNCGAELPTGNYGAPFSMAGFTGHPLADSRVIGSWGYGLSGTGATIGFSSGGVNAAYFTNLTVRGNTFIDCASIFYQDTGTTDGLIVDGNILIGGYRGIALEATTLTGGTTKQNISITKNTIGIKNRVNGSIEGIFIGNADTTNVNISGDNLVTYDSSGAGTSTPWGVQASNVVSGICRQNCFADVNNKFLGTGVLRSKNRGPDGAILADANIADNDIPTYIGSLTSGYGIRIASDKIEFLYNGAQAVRFDSSGDVVAKTGGAYEWDQQGALFTAADGQFYFTNWAGSPSTVRLGLGTNSPTSALQIGPTSNTATKYQQLFGGYNGTTGYPNILINNSGSEFLGIGALGPDLAIGSSASPAGNGWDVQFSRVFQTDGGMLLGTGTSSPGAKVFQAEGGYKSGDGTTGATGTDGFNSFKNGLATTIGTISGGDKLGLTPTAVKTANYSAAAGDLVPVDTTSGNVTVTLPTAPADKTVVAIKHVIQGSTNTVSLATGGSDVFNKAGGGTTGTLTLVNQGLLLQYKASGAIWYAIADDVPLSGMDTRYVQAAGTLAIASFGSVTGTLAVANGGTGITSFGSGIATFLGTPTEANLKSVVSGLGWLDTAGTWTAAQINSTAGAASAPAMKYSGVPFAGTGTTSFPLVYLNDSSATASTTLATAGTYLGVNGHGTADLANFLLDGTSKVKISSAGAITAAGNVLTSASYIGFSSSTVFRNQSDGVVTLFDNANTSFGRLQLGGTTSSFPAIKRSSAGIAFRLADDSADTDITAANAIVSGTTDSTTSTTGSLKTAGGLGVAKAVNVGTTLNVTGVSTLAGGGTSTTATAGDNTTQIATTAFVKAAVPTSTYRILLHAIGSKSQAQVAATSILPAGGGSATIVSAGTITGSTPPETIYIAAADNPSVNGAATTLRIRGILVTNATAPTGDFTFGLYPVTKAASSGDANNSIYTIGTVVSGSTALISAPSADTLNVIASSDFTLPSDGYYVLGVVNSATVATNARVQLTAYLQAKN